MRRKRLLFTFIILKNALLKKKPSITVSTSSINFELLGIFKTVGLITNFYKVKGDQITIIFYYSFGKPVWKIKTHLSKDRISKTKVRDNIYKREPIKGGLYLMMTPKGLVLDNFNFLTKGSGRVLCVFFR